MRECFLKNREVAIKISFKKEEKREREIFVKPCTKYLIMIIDFCILVSLLGKQSFYTIF